MKITRYILSLIVVLIFASSCETSVESLVLQEPIDRGEAYYENLRAYKKSRHQVAFGWFDDWSGETMSSANLLSSVPDSVDIIALWGSWGDPDDAVMMEDLNNVQNVKGTAVLGCTLLRAWDDDIDELVTAGELTREEGWRKQANRLGDRAIEIGLRGIDIDYEPGGGGATTIGCPRGQEFYWYVEELGKRFGPRSGTDRMLIIDGEISAAISGDPVGDIGSYFDYAVAQAYGSTAGSLQSRYDQISSSFRPEQFIVTENFESNWRDGGVLLQQAAWNPTQGQKGGCGTYHMEYEYGHTSLKPYHYLREAIKTMNPPIY